MTTLAALSSAVSGTAARVFLGMVFGALVVNARRSGDIDWDAVFAAINNATGNATLTLATSFNTNGLASVAYVKVSPTGS